MTADSSDFCLFDRSRFCRWIPIRPRSILTGLSMLFEPPTSIRPSLMLWTTISYPTSSKDSQPNNCLPDFLVSRSQTTISENGWQSIHFNCSLIQLVVPEPEGVLVTWIHMTWSYLFRDVLCKFILCCSTIPLYAIVTGSVHLCDISLSFLLYSKILAVVSTLVMFYFASEWSVLMTSYPMLCFTDVQSYSNTKWLLMIP